MARGGLKFLRGSVMDYVRYFTSPEKGGCLDHGYYGEGQQWSVSARDGLTVVGSWTPEAYAAWLSGVDPVTGEMRGRQLHTSHLQELLDAAATEKERAAIREKADVREGVRAYEFGVNVPKSASVAAALDADLAAALRGAQERAAVAGVQAVRRAAQVRIFQGGETRLVGVDAVEVAVFGHDGSREGDPHVHLHVQVGSKVFVEGKWRALNGRAMVRALGDWQATVGAHLATDPEWTSACARAGLTVTENGGVAQIGPEVEALFSRRNTAIVAVRDELVTAFRAAEGRAPNAREMVVLDQQAWSRTRPKKGDLPLLDGDDVRARLQAAGMGRLVEGIDKRRSVQAPQFQRAVAQRAALEVATGRAVLTERDLRLVAAGGIAAAGGACDDVEGELAIGVAALRAQCVAVQLPTGEDVWVPAAVMTSAVDVQERLARIRDAATVQGGALRVLDTSGLSPGQALVAEAIAGGMPVVVEGPAGTGKTHAIRRALDARNRVGLATFAVAPSRTAVDQMGDGWTDDATAHLLLARGGWEQVEGRWVRPATPERDLRMSGAVVVVDEAGMLDLHTMSALLAYCEGQGARVALVGDDRQLGAVGVAGGFALAKEGADVVALTETRRFADADYGVLAANWRAARDVEAVADAVMAAGMVRIHATEHDAYATLAEVAGGGRDRLVMVADNAAAVVVNRLVRAEHEAAGTVGPAVRGVGRYQEEIGVGDLVQTRSNDRKAGLVNRQRWIVEAMGQDGSMVVHRADRATIRKTLGSVYVAENVHRADAVTVHAAQGATAGQGHALLDESWTREQAYVALTRGKAENVLHVVAEDADEARAVVLRVLRSSEADRSAVLVALAKERHQQARVELTPGIAGRIRQATRSAIDLVGRWGSTSTLTATRPAAPAVAPEIPTRPPAAEL